MTVQKLLCLVLITVIHHRTIIAGQQYDGVIRNTQLIQGLHNLTHRPVELHDGISTHTHAALSTETLMRETRHVDIVGGKI